MTPRQVLAVLKARWPWIVLVLLLSVAASAAVSLTMLKRYTASATVMLDARSPDQVAGGAPVSYLPAGYLATQSDFIVSERVAREALRQLGLDRDKGLRATWEKIGSGRGDFEAWVADSLTRGLGVRVSPASNIISISYTSADPDYAAKVVNAFVQAYMDSALKMRTERVLQFSGFFDARAKELKADLQRAQERLSEYQQKNGLLVGDDRLNIESVRLAELNMQLLAAQSAGADMAGRLRRAGDQTDQLNEVTRSPAVAALSAEVTREEVRLRELGARLGGNHPQLIEQQTRLSELQAKLAAEKGRAVNSIGFDTNSTQSRVAQISASLEAQRAKVLKLQSQREQSVTLQRDFESAQRAYEQMQQRVAIASLESQNTHTNVTVLKNATAPIAPSSPNLLQNIGASVVAGLLVGIGLVLGLEQLDRRLRSIDDIAAIGQPMLVAIPVSAHAASTTTDTSRTRLMKQRVLSGLPRPVGSRVS